MESLAFTRTFLDQLPGDPRADHRPRQVLGAAWSAVQPTPVAAPTLLAAAQEVADLLGLDPSHPTFAPVFGGNALLPGMAPYSACYGGHQFGHWAGQLGDGRAITLGEAIARDGTRQELQLKGAGPTPYSRTADGRAVLRSSVREFVCSEAMFHLGVPTTRALSLVGTGERVLRDMFYDGRAAWEPGAVVCRVAPSFLRFGSYELPAARGDNPLLEALLRYTITHLFPHLGPFSKESVSRLFAEVAERTMALVVGWERVGFVHGVMNTDNLSILGLTIDYGPYGWLEPYDPDWTPNTTDAEGRRYRFGNQARVALWNLTRLAEAWVPLVGAVEPFEAVLQAQLQALPERRLKMHRAKLGLTDPQPEDAALVDALFALLQAEEVDYTLFFRGLTEVRPSPAPTEAEDPTRLGPVLPAWYAPPSAAHEDRAAAWLRRYAKRVAHTPAAARRAAMNAVNPLFVPRNYLAQLVIDAAAAGDPLPLRAWLNVLRRPYDDQPEHSQFAEKRPEWARDKPGCSTLSCSS